MGGPETPRTESAHPCDDFRRSSKHPRLSLACHRSKKKRPANEGVLMKPSLLGTLAAAAVAAPLLAFGFATTATAQDDKQSTHAELQQRWAKAAIEAQLKGMKTSLRLNADQGELWAPFNPPSRTGKTRAFSPCKRSKALTCRRWTA